MKQVTDNSGSLLTNQDDIPMHGLESKYKIGQTLANNGNEAIAGGLAGGGGGSGDGTGGSIRGSLLFEVGVDLPGFGINDAWVTDDGSGNLSLRLRYYNENTGAYTPVYVSLPDKGTVSNVDVFVDPSTGIPLCWYKWDNGETKGNRTVVLPIERQ
jgi:hypothetical protein